MIERYRRWFEYEQDAHQKVLVSLRAVAIAERSASTYRKAATLMAHIVAARRLWLFRLGAVAEGPQAFFPEGVTLEELERSVADVQAAWSRYLNMLNDQELARVFQYKSLEGESYQNTIEDILTQLFGHSWYHRGQIALLLRAGGSEPAVTDFVFWTREPLPAKTG